MQVPLASAIQSLHTHTAQAALAATLPQQTVLIQAQTQQTQAALNNSLAATLAGSSANGAYGNSQQLVRYHIITCLLSVFHIFFLFKIEISGTTTTIAKETARRW